ncbi:MAG: tRNA-dihydrouridine synthase family protein [Candidatus Absconditabacterales bacterium]
MILGLAPMDGFTDCAFRQITKEIFDIYGEKEKYELGLWTEFMNADGYIINPPGVIRHLLTDTDQSPVIAQIFGANEDMLVKCFSDIQKKYGKIFTGIELNMGCPARNVMNTGGGSALLKDRKTTLEIIKKLAGIIEMPFSIKTRTGMDENDLNEQINFLVEISAYVSIITVHGRTVKQGYSAESNWDFIYELRKKSNKKCKVLGSGGIKSYEDIEKLSGNLDGVMIGQAAIGNPRILTPHSPSREEIKTTILKHLDYMISYENYFQEQKAKYKDILAMPEKLKINVKNPQTITLVEFRKHLFQYVKGIPESKEFKQRVATISEYKLLVEEIQKFLI